MKLIGHTVECNLLMNNSKLSDLTGNDDVSWVECSFKKEKIIAVRRCVDEGYEQCCVIHFTGEDYFIIDVTYEDAIKLIL